MQAWLFLLIAASFETAWTYSVKYMTFSQLKTLRWNTFYVPTIGLPILLPFVGYVVFGIANIYFFSMAIKQIPTPTAFAVWTAMALILIKAVDVFIFKANWSYTELLFIALIAVGIIGLRVYSAQ
ncbi:DMT family transporter [Spirosoma soli]|uniref:DMT family transporter n=1 Tax=Spirosoma soli TaxID=1770529 RepID=A0ABW5MAQ5_9BACT